MASDETLDLLRHGDIEVEGRLPWSSNATFLVTIRSGDTCTQGVYKPVRGERPLWDFPPGLHRREVAAFELSEAMGVGVVPPTVLRGGPLGEGSVQLFVDADHEQHYFTLYEERPDLHDQLRVIAVFDLIANNTDRKGGHCLLGRDGRVWAIDNGLCFSAEFKLRTVIWEFGGEAIPPALLGAVEQVALEVPSAVAALLTADEVEAVRERARLVVERAVLPIDASGRRYPWPVI
jgi:uncharacterized repeat protein (TIGR03843 family)